MHESSAHMRAPAERVRNARGSALQRSVRHSRAALALPAPAPLQRAALTLALRDPPLPPPRDPAVGGRIPLSASPGGLRDGRGALRHARTQALGTPDLAMGLRCTKDQHPSRESQSQPVRTTCALEGALRAERMRRAARPHGLDPQRRVPAACALAGRSARRGRPLPPPAHSSHSAWPACVRHARPRAAFACGGVRASVAEENLEI